MLFITHPKPSQASVRGIRTNNELYIQFIYVFVLSREKAEPSQLRSHDFYKNRLSFYIYKVETYRPTIMYGSESWLDCGIFFWNETERLKEELLEIAERSKEEL